MAVPWVSSVWAAYLEELTTVMVTFRCCFANGQGLDIVEDALVVWNGRRAEVRVAACVYSCRTSS